MTTRAAQVELSARWSRTFDPAIRLREQDEARSAELDALARKSMNRCRNCNGRMWGNNDTCWRCRKGG